jgi:2,3-bisphosphoglycerate-independent phosphoglycerate mutase
MKKVILLILDGLGIRKEKSYNGFEMSNANFLKNFFKSNPTSFLKAHGSEVGLPDDQMGNSEVGHITIGSGRIVLSDFERINKFCSNLENFEQNINFNNFLKNAKILNGKIHLAGLLSSGGVHSHENHFFKMIEFFLLKTEFYLCLHIFLDGRDTLIHEGKNSLIKLIDLFKNFEDRFEISSVVGRSFSMDRDKRFKKTKIAFDIIVQGAKSCMDMKKASQEYYISKSKNEYIEILSKLYNLNISDEYIPPIIFENYRGITFEESSGNKDSIFFINWRADRMKQIASALTLDDFQEFDRFFYKNSMIYNNIYFSNSCSFAEYSKEISKACKAIFYKEPLENCLGDILEKNNMRQLRIAETEKYAHVTFFFDGGIQKHHNLKHEILIDSLKDVKTYDEKPHMSANEVKSAIINNIEKYDIIIANFANPDMIGHTGNFEACIKTMNFLDTCVKEIDENIQKLADTNKKDSYFLVITSDHGNIEEMFDFDKNEIKTSHSLNPVPFSIKSYNFKEFKLKNHKDLGLKDISKTICYLLNIKSEDNIQNDLCGKNIIIDDIDKSI